MICFGSGNVININGTITFKMKNISTQSCVNLCLKIAEILAENNLKMEVPKGSEIIFDWLNNPEIENEKLIKEE